MTKATDTGKWEEMVEAGAIRIYQQREGTLFDWHAEDDETKESFRVQARDVLQAAGVRELVELEQAIRECNEDTFECPVCGHSEAWWSGSNADELTDNRYAALSQKEDGEAS